MNKDLLIQKIARDAGLSKSQANRAVKSLVRAIRETFKEGGKLSLSGLGTFKIKARKARPGRNPKTGECISLPAGKKISFRPSLSLRLLVKGGA